MANQFQIWKKNRAAKGPARSPGLAAAAAMTAPRLGPEILDSRRDAWANAMSTMGGVNTPDPITAAAKVAGMGFAGWQQGKAEKERDAGSRDYQMRLADALSGKQGTPDLMSLYADPYASAGDKAAVWRLYERNNPTQDELLQRQQQQQQLELGKLELDKARRPQYKMSTGPDGKTYWVPDQPGEGDVLPVEGMGVKPPEPNIVTLKFGDRQIPVDLNDPKGKELYDNYVAQFGQPGAATQEAPKDRTFKTTGKDGQAYEVTQEWRNGQWVEVGRAPHKPGGVNIDMGGGNDKSVFDEMRDRYNQVRTMGQGLRALQEAKKAIMGGAITGPGANTRLLLQRIGAAVGIADPEKIVNTETFRSAIAPQVAAMIKATVGSTQISNTDRDFAMMAVGGDIELNEGTILRLVDIMERANIAAIDDYQSRLDKVYDPNVQDPTVQRSRALFEIQDPPPMEGDLVRLPEGDAEADAAYEKLPSGAWFRAPDGSVRRKP